MFCNKKHNIQRRVETLVRSVSRDFDTRVEMSGDAKTDGKDVTVLDPEIVIKTMGVDEAQAEEMSIYTGLHESFHKLYTDFGKLEVFLFNAYKDGYDINRLHMCHNWYEDMRVEACGMRDRPGTEGTMRRAKEVIYAKFNRVPKDDLYFFRIAHGRRYGLRKRLLGRDREIVDFIDACFSRVVEPDKINDDEYPFRLAIETYEFIWGKPEKPTEGEPTEPSKGEPTEPSKPKTDPKPKGKSGTSSSIEKNEDESEEGEKGEGSGSDISDKSGEDEVDDDGFSGDSPDDGSDSDDPTEGECGTSDSPDDIDAGSSGAPSDYGDSRSSSSAAKPRPVKAEESEALEKIADILERSRKGAPGMEKAVKEQEEKDRKDKSFFEESARTESFTIEAYKRRGYSFPFEVEDRLLKQLPAHRDLNAFRTGFKMLDVDGKEVFRALSMSVRFPSLIQRLDTRVAHLSQTIRDKLRQAKELDMMPRKSGSVSPKYLWRTAVDDAKIFTKTSMTAVGDYAVYILVDYSGSTSSHYPGKQEPDPVSGKTLKIFGVEFASAYTLAKACQENKIPCRVDMFSCDDPLITHACLKDFDDRDVIKVLAPVASISPILPMNNRDGWSIRIGTSILEKRHERNKIYVIISDGLPEARGYRDINDTAQAVREARKKGFKVMGVYVGGNYGVSNVKTIYGDDYATANQDESSVAVVMANYLRRIIR